MTLPRNLLFGEFPHSESGLTRSMSVRGYFAYPKVLRNTFLNSYGRATALAPSSAAQLQGSGSVLTGKTPFNTQ
jgi:hypothetical protein